jgi:hypothetical protein
MVPVGSDNSCAAQLVGPRSHTARHGMRPRQRSLRKRGRNHEKVPQRPPRYWAAAIDRAAVRRSGGERPADAGARRQRGPRTAVKNRVVPPTVAVVWQRVAPGRWVSTRSRTQQGAYSANVAEDRRWTLRYSDDAGGHDERVVGRYDTLGQCRRAAQRHQDRNASGVVKPIEPLRWRRIRNGLYEADAENRRTYRAERGRDETGWVLQFYDGAFDVFSVVTLAHVRWLSECKVAAERYRRTGTACIRTERKALGNAG